jgi:glycosyltransferase involved in cell wall biosynthesis
MTTDVGIHQILVNASPGDAITNMAVWLRDLFRRAGPSEIYALHVEPDLRGDVHPLGAYRARHARNVLVFHASIGQPAVQDFLRRRREPLVLVYHNITPACYFERYDVGFAELLSLGRREVLQLRPRVSIAVADSEFNAAELRAMGYRDVRVVPPIADIRRLAGTEPDAGTLARLDRVEPPIVLCVAQLMPHKRPDFLIEALHVAHTYNGLRGSLLLVGHQRLARYAYAIREQIHELHLPQVHVTGAVSDAELAAMFRRASLLVSASEHEGFCLPVVEAMTFGVPVVARACAAIPETVRDAALLLPESAGPLLMAEAIGELLANDVVKGQLARAGAVRVTELEQHGSDVGMLDALLQVA